EWKLELVRPYAPPADALVEVAEFPSRLASQLMLRLRVYDLDGGVTEETVFVRVQVWRDALVTAEPLTRGAALDSHQIESRRVVMPRTRDVVPSDTDVAALLVNRPISAGRIITWRDVIRRPLVRRGQMIDVNAVDGPLAVTMKALAL